jgi:MYXO-CTERM domain-containing protein
MKKLLATAVLSFGLLLSLPAMADQTSAESVRAANTTAAGTMDGANNNNNNANNTTRAYATTDNDMDWGWIGLAGLLGLAGLRNRSKDPEK